MSWVQTDFSDTVISLEEFLHRLLKLAGVSGKEDIKFAMDFLDTFNLPGTETDIDLIPQVSLATCIFAARSLAEVRKLDARVKELEELLKEKTNG